MEDLGKAHIKEALLRVHPFLKQPFRKITAEESTSEEVCKELFPNDKKIELYKLHAIYVYQN